MRNSRRSRISRLWTKQSRLAKYFPRRHSAGSFVPYCRILTDRTRVDFNLCVSLVRVQVRLHAEGEIIVFDDSKLHKAFNESSGERLVLIVDILPATARHTSWNRRRGSHAGTRRFH